MPDVHTVITGAGVVSSIGIGFDVFTDSVQAARSGVIDLRDLDASYESIAPVPDRTTPQPAAPIVDFDAKAFVKPRKALKVMCREVQTAYAASQLAIRDAGLNDFLPAGDGESPASDFRAALRSDRVGTVFGTEMFYGQPSEIGDAFVACCDEHGGLDKSQFGNAAMRQIMPLWMLKYLPNMPACHVGIAIAAHGPNNTLTVGDVSGPAAMYEACGYLHRGIADVIVSTACGTRLNTTRSVFREDQPPAAARTPIGTTSRPHATDAGGIVRGEASGSVILETAASARRRGQGVRAEVLAISSRFIPSADFAANARSATTDAARGSSAAIIAAMDDAIRRSGTAAEEIGLIVAHGMGDPVIDAAERQAITARFPGVAVTLPISLLGHTGAASGMMGVLTGLVALDQRTIPPVPHAADCPEDLSVSSAPRALPGNHILVICHTSPGSATAMLLRG